MTNSKHQQTMDRVDSLVESIGIDQFIAIAQVSLTDMESLGYCLECHDEADGVEPDAERYRCGACGAFQVYGIEAIVPYMS